MYETFDHTADLGLRIRSSNLNSLFQEAAEAMFSTIIDDLTQVKPETEIVVEIPGEARDYLLFDWLRELLYRFDADHMLFSKFLVEVREDGLTGHAWGEKIDPQRHILAHEVKAITYHHLLVEETADGWLAEVIVDI